MSSRFRFFSAAKCTMPASVMSVCRRLIDSRPVSCASCAMPSLAMGALPRSISRRFGSAFNAASPVPSTSVLGSSRTRRLVSDASIGSALSPSSVWPRSRRSIERTAASCSRPIVLISVCCRLRSLSCGSLVSTTNSLSVIDVPFSDTAVILPSAICTFPPMARSHSATAASPLVATAEAAIARFGSGLDDSRIRNSAFGSFDVSSRTPGARHAAVAQVDRAQVFQARQLREAGIRDLGAIQAELFELGHVLQHVDACVSHVRALEVQPAKLRQPREIRQADIGHVDVGEIELDQVRQPGEILDARIGNRRAAQIHALQRRLSLQARHAGVVERHRVVQIEMRQRKGGERHPRAARLVDAHLLQVLQGREPLQRGIVEGNVGLDGLAHHELLERRRLVEERDRGLHARRRLVVPQASVDVQLLEVRQRRQAAKLVLQRSGVHRDAREIQRVNAEVGRRQIGKVGNGFALPFEDDAPAHAEHPFRDHAIGGGSDDFGGHCLPPSPGRHPARRRRQATQRRNKSHRSQKTTALPKTSPDVHVQLRFKRR